MGDRTSGLYIALSYITRSKTALTPRPLRALALSSSFTSSSSSSFDVSPFIEAVYQSMLQARRRTYTSVRPLVHLLSISISADSIAGNSHLYSDVPAGLPRASLAAEYERVLPSSLTEMCIPFWICLSSYDTTNALPDAVDDRD